MGEFVWNHKWEMGVPYNEKHKTWRMRVPGGWIVKVIEERSTWGLLMLLFGEIVSVSI